MLREKVTKKKLKATFERPILYTPEEVAEIINVSDRTMRRYIKEGKIKGRDVAGKGNKNKRIRFTFDDIQAYFDKYG